MKISRFRVSSRGQMALPAEARRRWHLDDGGAVEVADLGNALLMVPTTHGGLRAMLDQSIAAAGGYADLVAAVVADEPDLA